MYATLQFSEGLQGVIEIAKSIANEFNSAQYSGCHLLKALLHDEIGLASFVESLGKDLAYLRDWADFGIQECDKSYGAQEPLEDEGIRRTFQEADLIRLQLSKDEIDPDCTLLAMLKPGVAFTPAELNTLNLTYHEVKAGLDLPVPEEPGSDEKSDIKPPSSNATKKYCKDKTQLARDGKLDPVIGRERELQMVFEILGQRGRNSILLIGEPGVGKTAIVNGLAQRIADDRTPSKLKSAVILELDLKGILAGASYKGEFEERLKNILTEIKNHENAIHFIDEIHALIEGGGGGGPSVGDLLKPELSSGDLTIIGVTTSEEYRKKIEPDAALKRRFELLTIEEPDKQTTLKILRDILPKYEEDHGLKISRQAIEDSIQLARRYIAESRLPSSAIDLIDRTLSKTKLIDETAGAEIALLLAELDELAASSNSLPASEYLEKLRWLQRDIRNRISEILYNQVGEIKAPDDLQTPEFLSQQLRKQLQQLEKLAKEKTATVESSDLAAVVSQKTGIPLGSLQTHEREKLLKMEEWLQVRVIGQDPVLHSLSEAVITKRADLGQKGKPITFFLLGPTGTGKTETAKALASFLFGHEDRMIRFDMNEFGEEHTVSALLGAPAGFVGFEEGGRLINEIRARPYSVVLFDEIEKAHKQVFKTFLRVLDEGKVKDRSGKLGDFTNAVILFTSNIGSDWIVEAFEKGETPDIGQLREIMGSYFPPEFLGRLENDILPFRPLSEENMGKIFDIQVKSLLHALTAQGIELKISSEAKKKLVHEGHSAKLGVRPLAGVMTKKLRRPISTKIIAGGDQIQGPGGFRAERHQQAKPVLDGLAARNRFYG